MIKSFIRVVTKNTMFTASRPIFNFNSKKPYGKQNIKNWQKIV